MKHNYIEQSAIAAARVGNFWLMNYILKNHSDEVTGIETSLLPLVASHLDSEASTAWINLYNRLHEKDEL